jgi:hypothetical protein
LEETDPDSAEIAALKKKMEDDQSKDKIWADKEEKRLRGAPILIIGRPTFKSSMKGHRASNPQAIIEYLKRFFAVIVISEYNTSKLCPCCHQYLKQKPKTKGTRIWQCVKGCKSLKKPDQMLTVNKDVSAAVNIFTIFITLLMTGKRLAAFSPKKN